MLFQPLLNEFKKTPMSRAPNVPSSSEKVSNCLLEEDSTVILLLTGHVAEQGAKLLQASFFSVTNRKNKSTSTAKGGWED